MPVIPNNVQITLKFNNDGTLSGFGGCNNYNGGYKLTGNTTEFGKTITIGPLATTAMYCADTADLESSYLSILQQTKTYSITNNKMLLRGAGLAELSYDKA
jgi:putative lipoprotein